MNFAPQHLSDEAVVAFADSALSVASQHRAERHLVVCAECRQAVADQREAASTLRSAAGPALPADLMARLMQLPQTTDLPPSNFSLSPEGEAVFPAYRPRPRSVTPDPLRNSSALGRRSSRTLLISAAALVTVGAASVAVAAMTPTQQAQDAPAPSMPARFAPAAFTTTGSLDAGYASGAWTQPIRRT